MEGARPALSDKDLEKLQRDAFRCFLNETNPTNGLVADNTRTGAHASIAPTGFALAAYPIGVERSFISRAEAVERTLTTTLRFFWNSPHVNGLRRAGFVNGWLGSTNQNLQSPGSISKLTNRR